MEKYEYYAKCPACKDYYEKADSLQDARYKVEQHEAEQHKGKPCGTFGKKGVISYE